MCDTSADNCVVVQITIKHNILYNNISKIYQEIKQQFFNDVTYNTDNIHDLNVILLIEDIHNIYRILHELNTLILWIKNGQCKLNK